MPIEDRTVTCDICGYSEKEERFGSGWPGWVIVSGIGACAPEEGVPLSNKNMEVYSCPSHRHQISEFINELQEARQ